MNCTLGLKAEMYRALGFLMTFLPFYSLCTVWYLLKNILKKDFFCGIEHTICSSEYHRGALKLKKSLKFMNKLSWVTNPLQQFLTCHLPIMNIA